MLVKLLLKEDVTPIQGNKTLHSLAPMIPVITALITIAVVPFGRDLYIVDINIAALYLLAVTSLGVYGVTLAGWASNSKFSLLGGLRAAAQMLSYELPMGMAVASVVLIAGSLRLTEIVDSQEFLWNIFVNPIAWVIFTVCAFAEANRTPFDLVEAEQELVGGFHTEYSGMKFGMFFLAEYMHVMIGSLLISTFFFGGYHLPFAGYWFDRNWFSTEVMMLIDVSVVLIKTLFFAFVFIWVRWTIPRFKFNQLMHLGWNNLLPLSIVNFMIVAIVIYLLR